MLLEGRLSKTERYCNTERTENAGLNVFPNLTCFQREKIWRVAINLALTLPKDVRNHIVYFSIFSLPDTFVWAHGQTTLPVIPAKAGIQSFHELLDSRFRGNDGETGMTVNLLPGGELCQQLGCHPFRSEQE